MNIQPLFSAITQEPSQPTLHFGRIGLLERLNLQDKILPAKVAAVKALASSDHIPLDEYVAFARSTLKVGVCSSLSSVTIKRSLKVSSPSFTYPSRRDD